MKGVYHLAKKNLYKTITTSAVIASALFVPDPVDAATYKVQKGDSLWKIAQKYETTVHQLKQLNHLTSDLIYPNQILQITKEAKNSSSASETKPKPSAKPTTYTVKRGDTLSGIAFQHGISLSDLMKWNRLETTLIYPGDEFYVTNPKEKKENKDEPTKEETEEEAKPQSATYTVKAGDSLWKIANHYGVSVNELKTWNKLSSDLIHIGQKLIVKKETSQNKSEKETGSSKNGTVQAPKKETQPATVYTVKAGDTLSKIAKEYGVTVRALKEWNGLTSDLIRIGQKLQVKEAKNVRPETPPVKVDYDIQKLEEVAKSLLGTKYLWGGQTEAGFDCSGFIYYTYRHAGLDLPRLSTTGYYSRSYVVDSPAKGDLVFFKNTYKEGISHMGIYLGNGSFIHAGSDGVEISHLSSAYWQEKFDSYKRFY